MGDEGATVGPRPDPERIAARIRRRADRIERRERERAVAKLDSHGGLTDDQRAAVAEMTEGIVEGLLATPERALADADAEQLRAALRVYGVDPDDGEERSE